MAINFLMTIREDVRGFEPSDMEHEKRLWIRFVRFGECLRLISARLLPQCIIARNIMHGKPLECERLCASMGDF
jgi:hypothetical protein